jgi:flavin reductase (DIM6/NTAB) family NADH-FMN oxidoreductase RutF
MTSTAFPSTAARAVGRIPSGLFVLGLATRAGREGVLVSWVQQASFVPLMISIAIRADRPIHAALTPGTRFVLNQLAAGQGELVRRFARSRPEGEDDFEGVALSDDARHRPWGGPVLADAVAVLHLEVVTAVTGGDHAVVIARVLDGDVRDSQAEPLVHLRKNGSHY